MTTCYCSVFLTIPLIASNEAVFICVPCTLRTDRCGIWEWQTLKLTLTVSSKSTQDSLFWWNFSLKCHSGTPRLSEPISLSREPWCIQAYKMTSFKTAGPWSLSATTLLLNLHIYDQFLLGISAELQMLNIFVIAVVWIFCFVLASSTPCELGCLLFFLWQLACQIVGQRGDPCFNETSFSAGCSAVVLFISFWSMKPLNATLLGQ